MGYASTPMPNPVLLDNNTHKDLRVRLVYGPDYGDNVGTVLAFPTEFADLQREYPIFFRRDANGEYFAVRVERTMLDDRPGIEDRQPPHPGQRPEHHPRQQHRARADLGAAGDQPLARVEDRVHDLVRLTARKPAMEAKTIAA